MTAVILAAGMGSRLVPITETRPKCLVKVAGKPILQYQIEAYRDAGVSKIIVVSGYFGSRLRSYVKRYGSLVECLNNDDYESTNNMYSLYLALETLGEDEEVVISNGDVVLDASIIHGLVQQRGSFIAVDKGSYDEESMKITLADGYAQRISKGLTSEVVFGNSIDVYKFEGKFLESLKAYIKNTVEVEENLKDWTEVAIDKVLQLHPSLVQPFEIGDGKWTEVDNYADLQIADQKFSALEVDKIELFFVDLDGTLFLGDQVIPGAAGFIETLQNSGKEFRLLSNNSSKSKSEYVKLLQGYGIRVAESEIVLSSDGAISHILKMGMQRVFVLGTEALRRSVEAAGLQTTGDAFDCVLAGYDTELTYAKLKQASLLLQNEACRFFATHGDVVCPTVDGPIPDIGSMLSLIEKSTGRVADKIFGKPDKEMVQFLIERLGVNLEKVAFVGDRLYTDMAVARNVGAKFILVLSGETQRGDLDDEDDFPDLVLQSVASVL
jgi:glycerol 3-phosphatase-2